MESKSTISFVLDNKTVNINFNNNSKYTPTTTLLKYLRSLPGHKSVKEGCGEGDCGACTVIIAEKSYNTIKYRAVNSCLIFLPSIHGKQVITAENLGKSQHLHKVQQAIVDEHASQCGFCTPGITMSLFSMYKNEEKYSREVTGDYLSGNLCRCTGYNSILNAAKSIDLLSTDKFVKDETAILKLLDDIDKESVIKIVTKEQKYFKVFKLNDALKLHNTYRNAIIINGSTDIALRVTKKRELLKEIIDISDVKELKGLSINKNGVAIAAGVFLDFLKDKIIDIFPALYSALSVFGSKQVRNIATIGGNIASASPIGDLLPVLIAYDASVVLQSLKEVREVKIRDFITGYRQTVIKVDELITEVKINSPKLNEKIRFYKVSKRKDLDISSVSGGFNVELDNNIVKNICLAYGGMAAVTKRAINVENYLIGKEWSSKNIKKAAKLIKNDFSPISDARAEAKTRVIMAENLLIKFYNDSLT